jgi:tRNA threonylcarbamoyladenosine biosynthesis protein TsaB
MTTLLAIETATEACSVALLHGDSLVARHEIAPRRHAALILPMIEGVLAESGVARSALDAIAVGRGPGAFTGVRLAIAVAQGLALALDRPVVPVSTLAALALVGSRGDADSRAPLLAAIDARMGELYAAVFDLDEDDLPRLRGDELLVAPSALALPPEAQWRAIGSGLVVHEAAIRAALAPASITIDASALPDALAIAVLGARAFARGEGVDAALAQPVYLRDRVAQTVAERLQAKASAQPPAAT